MKDGIPLVFHHGTAGSLLLFEPFIKATLARGLRYVSYSRPGYGNSTRQPARTIADCSVDTGKILDQLGVDSFYAIGWSGGSALAQAVIAASTIAGVAPYGSGDLDWLAGMGKVNIEEFQAALAGPDELRTFLESATAALAEVTGEQIVSSFGDLKDDEDKAALTGEFGSFLAENTREALRNGFWGWLDDDLAFTRD